MEFLVWMVAVVALMGCVGLLAATQNLHARCAALEARVAALEARNSDGSEK